MPTEFTELTTRVYEAMEIGEDRVTVPQVKDWLIRAVQELLGLTETTPGLWSLLSPLHRSKTTVVGEVDGVFYDNGTVAYPDGCLKLRTSGRIGIVHGTPIVKLVHVGDPQRTSDHRRPTLGEPWLEQEGSKDALPTLRLKPNQWSGKAITLFYVAAPTGSEVFGEEITPLLVYGAARIGLQAIMETQRLGAVDVLYKEALAKIGVPRETA